MAKKNKTFWLNYFRPSIFLKSYTDLNIFSLKKNGIKVLIVDLDNTLAPHFNKYPSKYAKKFASDLKELGIILIVCSNNTKKRVMTYCNVLKPDFCVWNAKKPLLFKINKVLSKLDVEKDEVIFLGDQFITDVWAANRIGCKSILVLPMVDPSKDTTSSNLIKFLDKFVYQKLQHKNYLLQENLDSKISERDYVLL